MPNSRLLIFFKLQAGRDRPAHEFTNSFRGLLKILKQQIKYELTMVHQDDSAQMITLHFMIDAEGVYAYYKADELIDDLFKGIDKHRLVISSFDIDKGDQPD